MGISVGTCGYGYYNAPGNWKQQYETKRQAFTHDFGLLEVQKTFYRLPRVSTCRTWRDRADDGFIFTLKAWQALTHPLQSPTWRGNDDDLTDRQRDKFGYLRPNETIKKAWDETLKRARALEAPVVVLQCPPSFEPCEENEENMRELLSSVDRNGLEIAWEPRGDWLNKPDRVSALCEELNLVHCVDLMRRDPGYVNETAYVRLHGLNDDLYDYAYDYSDEELKTLASKLRALSDRTEEVYCLFNNYSKFENVRRLNEFLD